jgi:hypothetical protein
MQEYDLEKAIVAVVYGQEKDSVEHDFTLEECQSYFDEMLEKIEKKDLSPRNTCEYCTWCVHSSQCRELKKDVISLKELVPGSKELVKGIRVDSDFSKLDPVKSGNILVFAKMIKKWAETIEELMKAKLIEDPTAVEGWELKDSFSKGSIDGQTAYKIATEVKGVDPKAFSSIVKVGKGDLMELVYGKDAGREISKKDFKEVFAEAITPSMPSGKMLEKK